MSLKCLNCHMVCAASDRVCPSCGYKVADTCFSGKKSSASSTSTKFALVFMVFGSVVFNVVLAPKWYPSSGGSINLQRVLMAGLVGMGCALVGAFFGAMMSDCE